MNARSRNWLNEGVREFGAADWVARPESATGVVGAIAASATPFAEPQGVPPGIPGQPRFIRKRSFAFSAIGLLLVGRLLAPLPCWRSN